jgi:hypothetical protein
MCGIGPSLSTLTKQVRHVDVGLAGDWLLILYTCINAPFGLGYDPYTHP